MIPAALYEPYSTALAENDRQARAALAAVVAQIDPADVDGVRDALLAAYPELVRLYGQRAAQVAMEFYMGVREAEGVSGEFRPQPVAADAATIAAAVSDVRREVGALYAGTSDIGAFVSTMQELATKRVMQVSDNTLISLAQADPAHPMVALVPHPGACGWCILIASRGFTNSEEAMGHMRHDGCKCTVVADFDTANPALEGYDEMEHYRAYAEADTAGNHKKWLEEWESMTDAERAKYVKRRRDPRTGVVKEHPGDWSTYVRNRTVQEMNVALGRTKSTRIDERRERDSR